MKSRCWLLIPLLFSFQLALGQAYYRLGFQLPQSHSADTANAFLVVYGNGTGFVRINQPGGLQYEMQLNENFLFNADGTSDTTIAVYEGTMPVVKKGRPLTPLKPLSFWFRQDSMYVVRPWMVGPLPLNKALGQPFHSTELLDPKMITIPLVLNYFSKEEPFFQNRFGPKPRGFLTDDEKKIRLLVLVVAQTYDKSIGPGTLVDGRQVFEMFQNVASFLGIKPVFDSVYGDKYGRANVLKAIDKLKPAPRDIVVFWYSGHGFSDMGSRDPKRRAMKYSFLDLLDPRQRPRPDPKDSTMNIDSIYELIKKKGARLNLIVSDCCNDEIIPKKEDGAWPWPKPKGPIPKWNWNNVYALFIKTKQSLLITSASQGEQSFADNMRGSVFTNQFIGSLNTNLLPDVSKPVWRNIWKTAQTQTISRINNAKIACPLPFQPNNACKQTPPEPKSN